MTKKLKLTEMLKEDDYWEAQAQAIDEQIIRDIYSIVRELQSIQLISRNPALSKLEVIIHELISVTRDMSKTMKDGDRPL